MTESNKVVDLKKANRLNSLAGLSSRFKVLAFLLLIGLTGVFVWLAWPRLSVVYLETGDIYFGKLSFLPLPRLEDAWVLQRDQNSGIALNPVSTTIWKPQGAMMLNPKYIVFWAEIAEDSIANQVIKSGRKN